MMTELSVPFIKSLGELPGIDADALARALTQTPPGIGYRLNVRKSAATDGANSLYPDSQSVEWCESGATLTERPVFTLNPLLHAGAFYVQDPSSMIHQQITSRLRERISKDSICVLDFCAAPGGKTTAVINSLRDEDIVVANEYVAQRGKILRENLQKWGFPNVVTTGDASSSYRNLPPMFDIIAIDAPCSGEGMMRKDADARSQWSERLVEECAALQREILSDIAGCLLPGGYLIYSTCTFNLHENEENSRYIAENLGLTPVSFDELGIQGIERVGKSLVPRVEALRFMPHITPEGEGLYVSVFRKEVDSESSYLREEVRECSRETKKGKEKGNRDGKGKDKKVGKGKLLQASLTSEMKATLESWVKTPTDITFELNDSSIYAIPKSVVYLRDRLRDAGVHITSAGVPAAEIKGKDIAPDSRLTLSDIFNREAFQAVDLELEDTLRFLRRESFPIPEYADGRSSNISRGYVVIQYKGYPLGIMKNLGNRANNLFPQAWRIHI